jgi:ABC-type transporter Mla subunit MlaD
MIIESVAAASAFLSSLNSLIKQVNDSGRGIQQLMGTISDFGEALTNFEVERKSSTFKPLSQSEILKLTQIKKSYERYWKDVHDILLVADPDTLEAFKKAKAEQEVARQQHLRLIAKRKKEREVLMNQLAVGGLVFLVGAIIAITVVGLVIKTFGG